jgi:hypothetical protein
MKKQQPNFPTVHVEPEHRSAPVFFHLHDGRTREEEQEISGDIPGQRHRAYLGEGKSEQSHRSSSPTSGAREAVDPAPPTADRRSEATAMSFSSA